MGPLIFKIIHLSHSNGTHIVTFESAHLPSGKLATWPVRQCWHLNIRLQKRKQALGN